MIIYFVSWLNYIYFYDPATSSFSTLNKLKDVSEYFTTNSDHPPLHGPKNYTERSLIPMTEVPAHYHRTTIHERRHTWPSTDVVRTTKSSCHKNILFSIVFHVQHVILVDNDQKKNHSSSTWHDQTSGASQTRYPSKLTITGSGVRS